MKLSAPPKRRRSDHSDRLRIENRPGPSMRANERPWAVIDSLTGKVVRRAITRVQAQQSRRRMLRDLRRKGEQDGDTL